MGAAWGERKDRRALGRLRERHSGRAFAAAWAVAGSPAAAAEAVEEAVLGLLRGGRGPLAGERFGAYLAAAARNQALDRRRAGDNGLFRSFW